MDTPLSPKRPRQDDPSSQARITATTLRPRTNTNREREAEAPMLIADSQGLASTSTPHHPHTPHTSTPTTLLIHTQDAPLGKASGPGPYKAVVPPSCSRTKGWPASRARAPSTSQPHWGAVRTTQKNLQLHLHWNQLELDYPPPREGAWDRRIQPARRRPPNSAKGNGKSHPETTHGQGPILLLPIQQHPQSQGQARKGPLQGAEICNLRSAVLVPGLSCLGAHLAFSCTYRLVSRLISVFSWWLQPTKCVTRRRK